MLDSKWPMLKEQFVKSVIIPSDQNPKSKGSRPTSVVEIVAEIEIVKKRLIFAA